MQQRVERLHRHWTKDRTCLLPATIGKLAALDPAVLVTPPKGLEVGCVPIVTARKTPTAAAATLARRVGARRPLARRRQRSNRVA